MVSQHLIYGYLPIALRNRSYTKPVLALLGTLLLTLSAKIQIPFWPVPTSMQSFTVILLATLYGRRLGVATVLLYIFEGIMGLPVFINSHWQTPCLSYIFSYTGGYLLGFVVCAYVIGSLSEAGRGKTVWQASILFTLGIIIIDIPGVSWLANLTGIRNALNIALSYQLASLLKIGLGSVLLPVLWNKKIKLMGHETED